LVYNLAVNQTPQFLPKRDAPGRADPRKTIGKDLESLNGNKNGSSGNGHRYFFDSFEIDPSNRACLRDGVEVPMTGRVFDILLVFAENPGRLLKKDELIEKVWRGDAVEDGNLARNISTLRKALGDGSKEPRYIVTVQGHGYRFIANVAEVTNDSTLVADHPAPIEKSEAIPDRRTRVSWKWLWAIPVAVVLLGSVWFGRPSSSGPHGQIKSLAVLPLKPLDANENYLGAGIADAVIRRLSQTGQLIVRPTSAVLHYLNEDKDALAAGRELHTDAALEGTIQRADGRMRVSVNLLRTADGISLWTESFDLSSTDVFTIEDKLAEQVASRLRLHLDPAQQSAFKARYPTFPNAYEFYIKGIFSLDERGYGLDALPQMETTIGFLKNAIDADPNYRPARGQLAFAYVWTALFIAPADPKWVDLARSEIRQSQEHGTELAETHVARALLLWSGYEGYKSDESIRELILAQQLNSSVGHDDLAALYGHIGLEDLASRELQRAVEIDPTSQSIKELTLIIPYLSSRPDEWYSARQRLSPGPGHADPWYYLRKGQLDEAQKAIDERLPRAPENTDLRMQQALLLAIKGNVRDAVDKVPGILAKVLPNDQSRHHNTYDAACVYALAGNSREAVKLLKETAATGFPNYPLFERDPFLDRVRNAPEFVQFIGEQKTRWQAYRDEFVR